MKYLYKCKECEVEITVEKPIAKSASVEYCNDCGSELVRVYTPAAIKTSDGMKC